MIRLRVRLDRRFDATVPNRVAVVSGLAELAASILRRRVDQVGRDADGNALPQPKSRWLVVLAKSPLAAKLPTEGRKPYARKGQRGPPKFWRWNRSYLDLKVAAGGKPWRGGSLTGAMWDSLTADVKPKGRADVQVRLRFSGSVRSDRGGVPVRFQNRDKAHLLQYSKRKGATGGQARIDARAADATNTNGKRDFVLMRLSTEELQRIASRWVAKVRLFRASP